VHGACVSSYGVSTLVVPGRTPCLRCLQPELPPAGSAPTCDTVGILGPAAHAIASLEAAQALRWLVTREVPDPAVLITLDVWDLRVQHVTLPPPLPGCPCCGERRFEFLAAAAPPAVELCGRDAILVRPAGGASPDFAALGARLQPLGELLVNDFVLRFRAGPHELTLFRDGRVIVKGAADTAAARSLVARYLGA
jgi:adenylyltransferase/sulfurtransferase